MRKKFKKLVSIVLSTTLTFSTMLGVALEGAENVLAATTYSSDYEVITTEYSNDYETEETNEYGLRDNIQEGNILHCFNWRYIDIKAELENIAEAGFTAIQISPAQKSSGSGEWYWLYQPLGFYVGDSGLGGKIELKDLCNEAEKYGIKVIVDVVANHLSSDHDRIDKELQSSDYWHTYGGDIDWSNRWQVTHGDIGMQDLATENSFVQSKVLDYIKDLKACGVDGIRWDAAKHITLPSEGDNFWKVVTNTGLYNYGEILVGPYDGDIDTEKIKLMKEYTSYMTVTDSSYSGSVMWAFANGKVPGGYGMWARNGISDDKLIYWAESHDTYSNDGSYGSNSSMYSQNTVDRAYAIIASRNGANALYFSRPSESKKAKIKIGAKGSTHFTSDEVAEVNRLNNICSGEPDYFVSNSDNDNAEYKVAAVCRVSGAVVVLGSGENKEVVVENGGRTTKPGTYVDALTGNEWVVTATTMEGIVGPTGIAVFYDTSKLVTKPKNYISMQGGAFMGDSVNVEIDLKNATSGTYKINDSKEVVYSGKQTLTLGENLAVGESVTVTLTATDGEKVSAPVSYTFKKVDCNVAYVRLPKGWTSNVSCYVYDANKSGVSNGIWPGEAMTYDAKTGYYMYVIPKTITDPRIIFYNNDSNRYPANGAEGLTITSGSWVFDGESWMELDTYQKLEAEKEEISAAKVTLSNTSFVYTGNYLRPGVTVKNAANEVVSDDYYKVTYSNNKDIGKASVEVTFRGKYKGTVTKTFSIVPKKTEISSLTNMKDGIKVAWKKNTTASGYYVYKSVNGGAFSVVKTITSNATVSYLDKNVVSGKKYQYKIIAYKSVSNVVYKAATSAAKTTYRVGATNVSSVVNAASGITVKWAKNSNATGYYLYRASGSGTYTLVKDIKSNATTSFNDTKASTNGGKYQYKVVAYKMVNGTVYKNNDATSKLVYKIARPTVSSATNSMPGRISVKWAKNSKATGYVVKYVTGTTTKTIKITKNSTLNTLISSLKKGNTYKISIKTYMKVGTVEYSSEWSAVKSVKVIK